MEGREAQTWMQLCPETPQHQLWGLFWLPVGFQEHSQSSQECKAATAGGTNQARPGNLLPARGKCSQKCQEELGRAELLPRGGMAQKRGTNALPTQKSCNEINSRTNWCWTGTFHCHLGYGNKSCGSARVWNRVNIGACCRGGQTLESHTRIPQHQQSGLENALGGIDVKDLKLLKSS